MCFVIISTYEKSLMLLLLSLSLMLSKSWYQSHKTKKSVQLTHLKVALFTITQQRGIAIERYEK